MTPDKLLDAFGMVDDRYLVSQQSAYSKPLGRRLAALIAAVLLIALTVGTAMAASPEFRGLIFSFFQIETHEQPPAGNATALPTQDSTEPSLPGLTSLDVVDIDGIVNAHYFRAFGLVMPYEGGFYTCSRGDSPPEDGTFWEIQTDGIVDIGATRISFPLTHEGRTLQIILDYAIVNGKLCIQIWPQNLDENPVGNGWNAEPVGNRTDVVLLSFPVHTGTDYTHDYLLLDLTTLETTDIFENIPRDGITVDACRVTDDLYYALLTGIDGQTQRSSYWLCNLKQNTIASFDALTGKDASQPYFLKGSTVIFQESLGDGHINLVSYHIPTGVQNVIVKDTTRYTGDGPGYRGIHKNGGQGDHGLLFREDGSVDLIALETGDFLNMPGLELSKLATSESPDGSSVMIAYEEANERGELGYGFSALGILDPKTGVLQMLRRDISGNPESFRGWLDDRTVVISAQDDNSGYYVYVYQFRDK